MNMKFFLIVFLLCFYSPLHGVDSNTDFLKKQKLKFILGQKQEKVLNLGLEFSIAKDWKIYWVYPGDTGLPIELKLVTYQK